MASVGRPHTSGKSTGGKTANPRTTTIIITGAASTTCVLVTYHCKCFRHNQYSWMSFLYWLYTGQIVFSFMVDPLKRDKGSAQFWARYHVAHPFEPIPCSPKSMYHLASKVVNHCTFLSLVLLNIYKAQYYASEGTRTTAYWGGPDRRHCSHSIIQFICFAVKFLVNLFCACI